MSSVPPHYETLVISDEMLEEARSLIAGTEVRRTKASPVDTLVGHLGEMAFAEYYFGDWREHRIGSNSGEEDFEDIEVKASAIPFSNWCHLLVRSDYAQKRKPRYYVQVILNVNLRAGDKIEAGITAVMCGFATAEEVDAAPKRDWGAKRGFVSGYDCHGIPLPDLKPMKLLKKRWAMLEKPQ